MPPGSKTELCVHEITIMPRFNVDYDEVWREVSSVEFVNQTPSSEYDRDSFRVDESNSRSPGNIAKS